MKNEYANSKIDYQFQYFTLFHIIDIYTILWLLFDILHRILIKEICYPKYLLIIVKRILGPFLITFCVNALVFLISKMLLKA